MIPMLMDLVSISEALGSIAMGHPAVGEKFGRNSRVGEFRFRDLMEIWGVPSVEEHQSRNLLPHPGLGPCSGPAHANQHGAAKTHNLRVSQLGSDLIVRWAPDRRPIDWQPVFHCTASGPEQTF